MGFCNTSSAQYADAALAPTTVLTHFQGLLDTHVGCVASLCVLSRHALVMSQVHLLLALHTEKGSWDTDVLAGSDLGSFQHCLPGHFTRILPTLSRATYL